MPLLPLAAALLAGAVSAQPLLKMESVGQTASCTSDPNTSRDCGSTVERLFEAIKPVGVAGKPNLKGVVFKFFRNMGGVSVNCEQNGSAFESFSPASAEDCGGKTNPFIVAGNDIWSMAGACQVGGYDAGITPEHAVAFILLHEFAHLRLDHPKKGRQELGEFCMKQWFPAWIHTPDAEKTLQPIIDKHGKGNPAALQKTAALAALRRCADLWNEWGGDMSKVQPESIRLAWRKLREDGQQRELDADAMAKSELIPAYNALEKKSMDLSAFPLGTGTCTMLNLKGLQDAWATGYKMAKPPANYVSSHPESDVRAEKLRVLEEQI
jgi:hypothetical protein